MGLFVIKCVSGATWQWTASLVVGYRVADLQNPLVPHLWPLVPSFSRRGRESPDIDDPGGLARSAEIGGGLLGIDPKFASGV